MHGVRRPLGTLRAALRSDLAGVAGVAILALAATASAAPVAPIAPIAVEGEVIRTKSRWTADGSRIVTEATVRTTGGAAPAREVIVSQLGGTVDGLTMRLFHGPELLVPGMRVAVAAHPAPDLAQRTHLVLDAVRVLAQPPGYVRTGPTKAGNYLYWESGCVFVTPDSAGTKQLPGDLELDIVGQSIASWNTAAGSCAHIQIVPEPAAPVEVGRDGVNVIKFRDASWCRPPLGDDPARCYADTAAGLTTAVYVDDATSDRDGAIVDADIELNGENFAITHEGVTLGTGCRAELSNTLTHELGHLLGIEHPCLTGQDPPRIDDAGNPVPLCSNTSDPAIIEATMFNFQDCGEIKKATLEADDIAAVCGIYPASEDPGTCERVDLTPGGCCSTSGRPLSIPGLVVAALTGLVLGRRRRR